MSVKQSNWLFGIIMVIIIIISFTFASCQKINDNLTISDPNVIMDIDSNIYHSVIIGNQEWMVENLKVTHFNDGTNIKLISSDEEWKNETEPCYCWHNNIVNVDGADGLIYNFYAVQTNKLAPKGWHIPSDDEWKELELFIGIDQQVVDRQGWRANGYSVVLAATGWYQLPYGTCDLYGFSALPSGGRNGYSGGFFDGAYWWTSTQYDDSSSWIRGMVNDDEFRISRITAINPTGLSIRCVKNKP